MIWANIKLVSAPLDVKVHVKDARRFKTISRRGCQRYADGMTDLATRRGW